MADFQYQKPTPISFSEGRRALSESLARNRKYAEVSAQQRFAQQAKQVAERKDLLKQKQSMIDGIKLDGISMDERDRIIQDLEWIDSNLDNMNVQDLRTRLRTMEARRAMDVDFYGKYRDSYDTYTKALEPGQVDKMNKSAEDFEYFIDVDDYRSKGNRVDRPNSFILNQMGGGKYNPATGMYDTERGSVPVGQNLYFNADTLGLPMREIEPFGTVSNALNGSKSESSKKVSKLLQSTKTRPTKIDEYQDSIRNAYHDDIWLKKSGRKALISEYEDERGVLSSRATDAILNSDSYAGAMKLAQDAQYTEDEIADITKAYDYGMERTMSWAEEQFKDYRVPRSGGGSGGSGGSTKDRLPKIESSSVVGQEFFRRVNERNILMALPSMLNPSDFENISQRGFRSFAAPKKISNTFEGITDVQSAKLDLKSFAMDPNYQLYVHVGVPRDKEVWKLVGEPDLEFTSKQEAERVAPTRYTTVIPEPEVKRITEDEYIVVRPISLINAQGGFTSDNWKTSPSKEDDFYKNVLMLIGRERSTALGVTQKGEEETMRDAWKYLVEEYGY